MQVPGPGQSSVGSRLRGEAAGGVGVGEARRPEGGGRVTDDSCRAVLTCSVEREPGAPLGSDWVAGHLSALPGPAAGRRLISGVSETLEPK